MALKPAKNSNDTDLSSRQNIEQANQQVSHYHGHRKRLRDRFLQNQASIPDYELLEMLLGIAQPRKDTKPMAKYLLKIFKSLNAIVSAEVPQLLAIDGVGDGSVAMLKVLHEMICRILKQNIMDLPLLNSGERVMDYCRASMGYLTREHNRVLFLNSKNFLILDEMRAEGTIDYSYTYPREIITRALELRAKSMILVHNHPSGDPRPSKDDIAMTLHVKEIAHKMEMHVHDHIIVASGGCYSMRANGDI